MTYDEHRSALIQYLKAKVDICDWHAVRDAAVDIEIVEAREEEKRNMKATKCEHPSDRLWYESSSSGTRRKWCGVCNTNLPWTDPFSKEAIS